MATMVGELPFLDTNIQLIATDRSRPLQRQAIELLEEANTRGFHLAANGQALREYLAVATRPIESNGLDLGVAAAVANLEQFLKFLSVFEETESVALQLRHLVLSLCHSGQAGARRRYRRNDARSQSKGAG